MSARVIHGQNLLAGKILITLNEAGCWLEIDNGLWTIGARVTLHDLETLCHAVSTKKDEIRDA